MQNRNGFTERLAGDGPTLVEVYGDVGLDFVFLDYEHAGAPSPSNTADLENLVRAAELSDVDLLVRIPSVDPALIREVLETSEAVANAAEILSVPDLGFAFVGHRDLTHSLGHGEAVGHPDVAAASETLREACLDAGVPVGRVAGDVADVRVGLDDGFAFFLVGYELDAVRTVFGEWVDAFSGGGA